MNESLYGRIDTQQEIVKEVLDEHVLVSGILPIDDKTWAIYGSIPVDGEVIVAEFENRSDAESIFQRIAAAEQVARAPIL